MKNPDGSFSTEKTITISADIGNGEKFYNIPTIINEEEVPEQEAVDYFFKTGENVGMFGSKDEAVSAAKKRSDMIGKLNESIKIRNKETGEIITVRKRGRGRSRFIASPDKVEAPGLSALKMSLPTEWLRKKVGAPEYVPGERSLLGNIFERPAAAVRSGILGTGVKEGYRMPEKVPSLQDVGLKHYWEDMEGQPRRDPTKATAVMGSLPVSLAGVVGDIVTNPADVALMTMGGLSSQIKSIKTLNQARVALKAFGTKERSVKGGIDTIRKLRMKALPVKMNDAFIINESKLAQQTAKGLSKGIGNAMQTMRKPYHPVKIDYRKIDDLLLRSDITDDVLGMVDDLIGKRVSNVGKAYRLYDIVQKKAGQAVYRAGGTTGKGGMANAQIRSKNVAGAIKDIIDDAIRQVDPEGAAALKQLDAFAHTEVYPKIDGIYRMIGRGTEPKTAGIASTYEVGLPWPLTRRPGTGLGRASERAIIRKAPKTAKELRQYVSGDYKKELRALEYSAKKLHNGMTAFRRRQGLKVVGTAGFIVGGGAGLLYGKGKGGKSAEGLGD